MSASTRSEILAQLRERVVGFDAQVGVRYEKLEPDEVIAAIDADARHHQPAGYLHGGVSMALAESVASIGATLAAPDDRIAFGMEINANHVRPFRTGTLRATARPLHVGRTTQVWEVMVRDDAEHLISVARCTLAIVEAPSIG